MVDKLDMVDKGGIAEKIFFVAVVFFLTMSLRERLREVEESPNTYTHVLQKDIARVETFIKECDKAIAQLDESAPVGTQIIALYEILGVIPYTPDKNDTIGTAATTVVLQSMINRYTPQSTTPIDFLEIIADLNHLRANKQTALADLQSRNFASPLPEKLAEARELEKLLNSYIAKINNQ